MSTTIDLTCDVCSEPFVRAAKHHKYNQKRGVRGTYCGPKCRALASRRQRLVEGICAVCEGPFSRTAPHSKPDNDKGLVCSTSCSAVLASRRNAAARREANGVKGICACGRPKKTQGRQCRGCYDTARDFLLDRSIGDLRAQFGTHEFHAKVRGLARSSYCGPRACAACGYSLHVDICHLQPVADFPPTATLREVNHPTNLAALDKRCHWEFDHGFLTYFDGQWVAAIPP